MKTVKLIKVFEFDETTRSKVVLGAKTRLNAATRRLQLKAGSPITNQYPTDPDITATTWIANPQSVRKWIGFEVVDIQQSIDSVTRTSLFFRISDGVNQYWWDGFQWIIDSVRWNSEIEVAINIQFFPIVSRSIGFAINLRTSDARVTPEVSQIKVLYEAVIDFQLDIIARTLVPLLRDNVRPISDFITKSGVSSVSSITLPNPIAKTPYNFRGVDSVFNHTDDPNHLYDLYSSFNASTNILTFNSPVPANKQIFVRFFYEPEVIITTSRNYTEVSKVPCILVGEIDLVDTKEAIVSWDSVINRATGTGWRVPAPMLNDINFTLNFMTDKESDQYRLADEAKSFFRKNPIIKSAGTENEFRLWLWDEYIGEGVVGQDEIHAGKLRAKIVQAEFFIKDATPVSTIRRIVFGGDFGFSALVEGVTHDAYLVYASFSSSGVGTEVNVGVTAYLGSFSSSGVGTEANVGSNIFNGVFSASGVGTEAAVGVAAYLSSFSSTGTSTQVSTGSATSSGSFSSAGVGSQSTVGITAKYGVFAATGVGTEANTGSNIFNASFSSTGVGTEANIGSNIFNGVFSASGVGTQSSISSTAPATYASILGNLLIEMWDSRSGVASSSGSVSSWTGKNGRVLLPPLANPVLGVDSTYFNGNPVVKISRSLNNALRGSNLSGLPASGTKPWQFSVFRFRTLNTGQYAGVFDLGVSNTTLQYITNRIDNKLHLQVNNAANGDAIGFVTDTAPHTVQGWVDTAVNMQIDSTLYTVAGTVGINQNSTSIGVGTLGITGNDTQVSDTSHALLILCSSVPSADQIAAVRSLSLQDWGV